MKDSSTPSLELDVRIPEHELFRPIASGSYGEVWLARSALGTWRAVKIVRPDDERQRQRQVRHRTRQQPHLRARVGQPTRMIIRPRVWYTPCRGLAARHPAIVRRQRHLL